MSYNDDLLELPEGYTPLITDVVLPKYYEQLYEILGRDEDLYVCVIVQDDSPRLFFEISEEKDDTAVCRFFWREKDVEKYAEYIRDSRKYDGSEVKVWSTTLKKMITSLNVSWVKIKDIQKKTLVAIASIYDDSKYGLHDFLDIEVFWSTDEENAI